MRRPTSCGAFHVRLARSVRATAAKPLPKEVPEWQRVDSFTEEEVSVAEFAELAGSGHA